MIYRNYIQILTTGGINMSMPFIIPGFGTRERAITDIIESTALQKTALAHIINAEGEKIQAALLRPGITIDKVLEVNDSVLAVMYSVTRLELILEAKLNVLPDLSILDTFLPELPVGSPIAPIIPIAPILSVPNENAAGNCNVTGTNNIAGTNNVTSAKKVIGSGNILGTNNVTSTGNASGTNNVTSTGNASGTNNVTSTGNASGTNNVTSTGNVSGTNNVTSTGNVSGTNKDQGSISH
jgi:hypothetical protein